MNDLAINVDKVTKIYRLYNQPIDRLKESLSLTKKQYHRMYYALNNVTLKINKGETVGIIGTNGAGKSTLLKLITGVLNPTYGSISIEGRISALLELGAGFNTEYTGIENIHLNGAMLGFSKEEIESRVQNIVDFADIGDFINQPVKTYSSGMFVRLAFAVAINIDPEILIIDEALSVGDVFFQAKCYKKFEEFKKQGKTILLVSHDLSSIAKYCDRTILLNKGEILGEGSSREMVDLYKKLLVNQLDNDSSNTDVSDDVVVIEGNWKEHIEVNPNKIEYGSKKAEIVDFGIFDKKHKISTTLLKDEEFTIKMKVKFNVPINDPIFAFTIKDIKGTDITGTNTMVEKIETLDNKKGDIIEIEFRQNMNLQGGSYILSLGCTGYDQDDFTVYHRLYDICSITVIAQKYTVGFYDINSNISVSKLE